VLATALAPRRLANEGGSVGKDRGYQSSSIPTGTICTHDKAGGAVRPPRIRCVSKTRVTKGVTSGDAAEAGGDAAEAAPPSAAPCPPRTPPPKPAGRNLDASVHTPHRKRLATAVRCHTKLDHAQLLSAARLIAPSAVARRTTRPVLLMSFAWALRIWFTGERLTGIFTSSTPNAFIGVIEPQASLPAFGACSTPQLRPRLWPSTRIGSKFDFARSRVAPPDLFRVADLLDEDDVHVAVPRKHWAAGRWRLHRSRTRPVQRWLSTLTAVDLRLSVGA
jgi:hypothetical protein